MEVVEFPNSICPEAAHNEPSHMDLHCLPSKYDIPWTKHFFDILQTSILSPAVLALKGL